MNISYMIYQAERERSSAERREADAYAGELAAGIAQAGRAVKSVVARYAGMNRRPEPVIPGDDLIPVTCVRQ